MVKLLFIPAIVLMLLVHPVVASAVSWLTANQVTVYWSHGGLAGGWELPETEYIEFRVWLSDAVTDPDHKAPISYDWLTQEKQLTITLVTEGKFFVGVQAFRLKDGVVLSQSEVSWSDNPEYCYEGNVFGLVYYIVPLMPLDLVVQ